MKHPNVRLWDTVGQLEAASSQMAMALPEISARFICNYRCRAHPLTDGILTLIVGALAAAKCRGSWGV